MTASNPSAPALVRTRWPVVALALCAGIVGAFHAGKVPPAIPALRDDLAMSMVAAGWVVSAFSVTAALVGAFAGLLADAVGHRRLLLAGMATMAAGGLAGAGAGAPWALLAARFVEGVGFAAVIVSAPAFIAQASAPRDRNLTLGIWSTYLPTGMALAMAASPVVLEATGWRVLWLAIAALALACLLPTSVATRAVATPRAGPDWAAVRLTLGRLGPWLLAAAFTMYVALWASLMVWLPTLLVEQRGAAGQAAALLTALVVLANVPGNLAGSWLLHRRVPRGLLMAVGLAFMGLSAQGIFSESLSDGVRFALCIGFSMVGGMFPAAVLASAPAHAASARQVGMVTGMFVQGANLGYVVGPPLVALIVTATGLWQATAWAMAAFAAVGLGLAAGVAVVERRAG